MPQAPPPPPAASRDFSTDVWKEFRLGHARPAAYVAALAAYGTVLLVVTAPRPEGEKLWLALGAISLATTIAAALHAARMVSDATWREELWRQVRDAGESRRDEVLANAYRRRLLGSLAAPGLALVLMVPLFLVPGLIVEPAGAGQLAVGAILWVQALFATAAAAAAGAWVGQQRAAQRFVLLPAAVALLAALMRAPLVSAGGLLAWAAYWGRSSADEMPCAFLAGALLAADVLVCLLAWLLMLGWGEGRLAEVLREPPAADPGREDPEGLGLEVSFWALFRWKLFRDPLFRVERRTFWTWRRLVIMWIVMAAGKMAVSTLLYLLLANSWRYSLELYDYFLFCVVDEWPGWIAAGLVAVTLASDRQTGVLESMRVTPTAPLRLAAARLAGKCCHMVLALTVLMIPQYMFDDWLFGGHWSSSGGSPRLAEYACRGVVNVLWWVFHTSAWAAVGLYFAARLRSLVLALIAAYGFVLTSQFVLGCLGKWIWDALQRPNEGIDLMPSLTLAAMLILVHAVLLRTFLMAAARQLAIRRGD